MLTWTFDERHRPDSQQYDSLALAELSLRIPLGSPSGGELVVLCLRGDEVVHRIHVALAPGAWEGMPDDLKAALEVWVAEALKGHHLVPGGAAPAPRPKPKEEPKPAPPPGFAPTLG